MLDGAGATLWEYIYWGNQQIALISNGTTYYVHNDHLNTPQVITNQNQQVVWMGDYEPFGKVASNPNNSTEIFSRFPGQYLDSETGLYYNYFRDYDPSVGRYIESDPIGLEGGINTYGYAYQNPIGNFDPDGRIVWFGVPAYIWIAGSASVGAGAACVATNCGQAAVDAMAAIPWEKPDRTPEDESQADAEHDVYKSFCNSPPQQTGNMCKDRRNYIKWLQQCKNLRQSWDDKWFPGRHADDIAGLDRAIKDEIRKYNNSWSCKEEPLDCE